MASYFTAALLEIFMRSLNEIKTDGKQTKRQDTRTFKRVSHLIVNNVNNGTGYNKDLK